MIVGCPPFMYPMAPNMVVPNLLMGGPILPHGMGGFIGHQGFGMTPLQAQMQQVPSRACMVQMMMGRDSYGIAPVEEQGNPEFEAVRAGVAAVLALISLSANPIECHAEDAETSDLEWLASLPPLVSEVYSDLEECEAPGVEL
eukprot:TRINITY_DN2357_c0_g2_i1.p1 TRINITY_DN2357_c0_g2~~TRINITY_DN2357_c0_g2_i1.p1  ORF type:complete len:143 (+),score=14.61 TRINITY_DN2357_c0_g2_i1:65-493(+)